jgi:hypothetical protein
LRPFSGKSTMRLFSMVRLSVDQVVRSRGGSGDSHGFCRAADLQCHLDFAYPCVELHLIDRGLFEPSSVTTTR